MSEKLCLKWDDFQENIIVAFGSFRKGNEFADVTVACEDGEQIEAHKVILAASSPFFEKILKENRHSHPLIFLRGVKMEDLQAAMDFMYFGETNVAKNNLDFFLAIAKELMIKGLITRVKREEAEDSKDDKNGIKNATIEPEFVENGTTTAYNSKQAGVTESEFETFIENRTTPAYHSKQANNEEKSATDKVADIKDPEIKELEEKVDAMVTKTDPKLFGAEQWKRMAFLCKVCGLEGTNRNVRKHVEAKHLERDPLPCNQCEKTCKTRRALGEHKMKYHEAKIVQKSIEEL